MSRKESNEITIKIKCELNEFYKIIEAKGFKIINRFSMDDTYFIPEETDIDKLSIRDILSKAVLVRDIIGKTSNKRTKLITFKIKNFDKAGNILNQESVNCNISETEDAKKLLKVIGYKEIMNIKEDDIVYEKDGFELAIKDIKNGDNLIEIETEENKELDTIEKLIKKVNKLEIPIYTDNYFVKKAEVELDKILNKRTNKEREKSFVCIITKDNKVLLIKQTKGHWGFPKGHVEKNETEIETAIREVKEETNNSDDHFDIETDHFKMNTKTREAYLNKAPIEGLTPKEFDLLFTLAKKPRQVFSREQLLELVWDYQYFGDERTVDAHIKKLRQKIEKVGPQVIQTVWGVGYKFDDSGVA